MLTLRFVLISLFIFLIVPIIVFGQVDSDIHINLENEVPVHLFEGLKCVVGIRGDAIIECIRGTKLSETYQMTDSIMITYRNDGLQLDQNTQLMTYGVAEIIIKPANDSSVITFNCKGYRGYIKCRYGSNKLVALNIIDIDDYLKGVLPAEIGKRNQNEYEAVKAQAIASRTYAIWKLMESGNSGVLSPTVADQVYSGLDAEIDILSMGVEETKGQIISFGGKPIAAFYHAVCGGHTSPVEKIWPDRESSKYLTGADDDTFCTWAKTYSWNEEYSHDVLTEMLSTYFHNIDNLDSGQTDILRDVRSVMDDISGRIEMVEMVTDAGIYRETSDRIRWALYRASSPSSILPSTYFSLEKSIENGQLLGLTISGKGNGHGVGMCQCGAIGRSRAGHNYEMILKHYYGPVDIIKWY